MILLINATTSLPAKAYAPKPVDVFPGVGKANGVGVKIKTDDRKPRA